MTDSPPEPADAEPTAQGWSDGGNGGESTEPGVGPDHDPAPKWPVKRFRPGRGQKIGNVIMTTLTRWALVPHSYVMTTRGRKTGRLHSNPVTLVEKGESRWLVAPYGPVSWVLNARTAGRVTLSRRGHDQDYLIDELPPDQAGPILKDYVQIASATRSYFEATKASPVEAFVAEASRHPVFALTPVPESAQR
jgi:deazaflavin-dependent oxidoreductase (nitroreductase family)